jgi:uncharacterized protein (TIGR02270 family)
MQTTTIPNTGRSSAFRDVYERAAVDCAFLWVLRAIAVDQPHYTRGDLAELEQRIDAQLDLLMSSPELGWSACEEALALQQPGEAFTAAVIALRSHEIGKIRMAIESGIATEETFKGVVSALAWLPAQIAGPWVERLLKGKDMNHKRLGVAVCGARRENPGEILNDILKREDCRQHPLLQARALRLVGELRRQDLMPALQANLASPEAGLSFWANWSSILLGQRTLVNNLKPFVLQPGPFQSRAIQLAFRVLPVEAGREWISVMAQNPENARAVVLATGILGDPHAINWLIGKMSDPPRARLAGEAFTMITGVDLETHALTASPAQWEAIPNDKPEDIGVGLDEDENLPWPHPERVAALWRTHGRHFLVGRRYFLGKAIAPDWLTNRLAEGTQRQRHAAALELALVDSQKPLANTRGRAVP